MLEPGVDVVLDLRALPADAEMSRAVSEALALAASVVLDRIHGREERYAAGIHGGVASLHADLVPVLVDATDRASYADPQEATEDGAEGVAVATARRVLGRVVFRWPPKGTGADYLMRGLDAADDDSYERLECSGIADGDEPAAVRLRNKLAQLARYPQQGPGRAVVTCFRAIPIEILHGSYPA